MSLQINVGGSLTPPQLHQPVTKAGNEGQSKLEESAPSSIRNEKQLDAAEVRGLNLSVGEEQLIRAINRAVKALESPTTSFEMKYHEQTKAVMIKVFNKETGELIREIPPEKTLDLVVKMMEIAGILVDEKI